MVAVDPTVHAVVLGQVIAALRKRAGVGQQTFSQSVGVSQATLSRIERGQAVPDHFVFTRMADALGMTPAELEAVVQHALANTRDAAAGATRQQPNAIDWDQILKIAGLVGLLGLAAFAVATVLSEEVDDAQ